MLGKRNPPETAPPQKPLNDASAANRLCHISSTVITDLDIFRLRPLRFLLLRFSRKSFARPQKPFRKFPALVARISRRRPAFKNTALGRYF